MSRPRGRGAQFDYRRIKILTEQGWSARRIAEELGCTKRTVCRVRVELGITKGRAPFLTADEVARAGQMLDDGASYSEVARTLGRSTCTVRRHFPGRGWAPRQCAEWGAFCRENPL